jgi:DnaJ-class molecular chaperone
VAAVASPPGAATKQAQAPRPQALFEGGSATLEEAILGVWQELVAEGRARCPVCGDAMDAADSAGACEACGAELS